MKQYEEAPGTREGNTPNEPTENERNNLMYRLISDVNKNRPGTSRATGMKNETKNTEEKKPMKTWECKVETNNKCKSVG
jgi:hypothetical protein